MFKTYIGSPFVFINTRIWKTKPLSERMGPNNWHKDGFVPGHLKIMVYLTQALSMVTLHGKINLAILIT